MNAGKPETANSLRAAALLLLAAPLSAVLAAPDIGLAQNLSHAASVAQQATVTLRVRKLDGERAPESAESLDATPSVEVFSGVLVSRKWIATSSFPASADPSQPVRITLPGGQQARGRLRAIDQYSQTALIETEDARDVFAELAADEDAPAVGSWILSAAGWGNEAAVVSMGIVSGLDRTLEGADLPPLLQCDLRAAATSSGAGLFDQQGRLLGVVLAVQRKANQAGWTYGIPGAHLRRLMRALAEHAQQGPQADEVLVLQRRRPTMGMLLEQEGERIVIQRVHPDSPAQRAGLRTGDQLLSVNGAFIRSVYQAVRPVLRRQPGDALQLLVRRQDQELAVEVVLGGGAVMPATMNQLGWSQPRVEVQGPTVAEVGMSPADLPGGDPQLGRTTDSEAMALLQRALQAYQAALAAQQKQLQETRQALQRAEAELQQLREK